MTKNTTPNTIGATSPGFINSIADFHEDVVANEAWLSGPIDGVLPELQPAAHMLIQSARELEAATTGLTRERLWGMPGGAASIAFHLRHIAQSTDRLLTYSRGESLSESQRAALAAEKERTPDDPAQLLALARNGIEQALAALRSASRDSLFVERKVGRAGLPSTVFGLLYHVAEHTVRHTGQIIATAKAGALQTKDEDEDAGKG
jgi:uncharacterized damage-inducible protein DinB